MEKVGCDVVLRCYHTTLPYSLLNYTLNTRSHESHTYMYIQSSALDIELKGGAKLTGTYV
jgi:hypothetical protein